MPKVSVIIPVYGVEKYLKQSLESVVNQTLIDIEIIIVDDESPDNSFSIISKFASNDNRIKVIRQNNRRQGGARNSGMQYATGEYIFFFRSR